MKQHVALTRQALKTPRAAAVAGIFFAVLFTASMVLIHLTLPQDLRGTNTAAWLQGNTAAVTLALTLMPFAGIAFLWFIGVVRDRLGTLEDQSHGMRNEISASERRSWERSSMENRSFCVILRGLTTLDTRSAVAD
jgi:hypothetical protein